MIWMMWLWGCAQPCEYVARCDGDVLQTCSLGVDQLFGSGESEHDCALEGQVCVEHDTDIAFCALDSEPSCTPGDAYCDGPSVVTCNTYGYEVAEDCTLNGPTCVEAAEPTCGMDPVVECDGAAFDNRCDGDDIVTCSGGVERLLVCDEGACGRNEETGRVGCL